MESTKIRLYGVVHDSIVDGPGLRYTLFTQGCLHHCPGCHNPESWDINGGYEEDIETIVADILSNPLLDGITLSGGEPFLQVKPLKILVSQIKAQTSLHIMIYSGYVYEDILKLGQDAIDLLSLRSLELIYKGSSNQRIIDIHKSLQQGRVYEQKVSEYGEFID